MYHSPIKVPTIPATNALETVHDTSSASTVFKTEAYTSIFAPNATIVTHALCYTVSTAAQGHSFARVRCCTRWQTHWPT